MLPSLIGTLTTGRDQSRRIMGIDPVADRAMADYIGAHVAETDAVLTDDSQTFGVMLSSGRPDLFLDRIDRGDADWLRVAEHPYPKVRYLLVSWTELDALNRMYHHAFTADGGRGLRLVYATRTSKLFQVVGPVR